MDWRGRITSDPSILVGKPTIKGTRISVDLIHGWLANGWSMEDVLTAYPHITRDDVQAALAFAAETPGSACRSVSPAGALSAGASGADSPGPDGRSRSRRGLLPRGF